MCINRVYRSIRKQTNKSVEKGSKNVEGMFTEETPLRSMRRCSHIQVIREMRVNIAAAECRSPARWDGTGGTQGGGRLKKSSYALLDDV